MTKCNCYFEQEKITWHPCYPYGETHEIVGSCNGTREQDECDCGGDKEKCTFYPDIKEKAIKEKQTISDEQELKLLKEFLKEYDMIWEFTSWVERNK